MKKLMRKRLTLEWIGKESRPKLEPRLLVEDAEKSYKSASTADDDPSANNLLIHGDNLLALKALEGAYRGNVKCVFIDPPYNTGSAFSQYDDGVEHSIWLTLMRSRIECLHRLLADDGSLWVTLDDNECHYFKVMCDEIFGRNNFVGNIVWQKKYTLANDAKWFSENHDHILVYAKDKSAWKPNKLPRSSKMNARYKNPDNHPKGPWKATPLHAKSGSAKAKSFTYTFKNGTTWSPPPGTFPRFSEKTLEALEEDDAIWFGKKGDAVPSRKTFLSELKSEGAPVPTVWLSEEFGHNHEARTEVKAFNRSDPFSTPKPEKLLYKILSIATEPNDIVLDSFLGSGTTAAVAHKMGRRWIGIELGEHFVTHCVPRLVEVVDGKDNGGVSNEVGWAGGGGFKCYHLAQTLITKDEWGNEVINPNFNSTMLAEAVCKIEGFKYAPDPDLFWKQGFSTERDFIYVTTQHLNREQLSFLSEEVGEDATLLVCCGSFTRGADMAFENLTVKKLPKAVLKRCEWGHDDYSLKVENLPKAPEREGQTEMELD